MENSFKICEVTWVDAQSSLDAIPISELEKYPLATTKSCGYLVKEDKEKVVLAFMLFGVNKEGEELMKHYQIIPKAMIKKIKVIRK